jgi:[ribosomal protein S18]-alanine N-acetyltransferase
MVRLGVPVEQPFRGLFFTAPSSQPGRGFCSAGVLAGGGECGFRSGARNLLECPHFPPGYNNLVEFTLREFRRDDFEILWRIDQECFAPGIAYSRIELAAYIRRPGSFTLVAWKASAADSRDSQPHQGNAGEPLSDVLGFIVAEANRRKVGHILTIDVPPSSRRLGVGSKLLSSAEGRLQSAMCRRVVLETAVDNAPALAFYKRNRYDVVKTIPRYYPNGLDAFVLEKELSPRS